MKTSMLCPSASCKSGAKLIGMVNNEGTINLLEKSLTIDEDFVSIALQGKKPEERFRFADRCMQGACSQWAGNRCGIVDRILEHVENSITNLEIAECSIRPQCRWFNQNSYEACKACPLVITDVSELHFSQ